ncbi:hypothetical protein V6Z11_A11G202400 [Gossypium hirsutum]
MLWLWRWGLPPPDRGRSRSHRSYLRRVCRLKEEGRQNEFQRKNRKSRAVQSGILLRSIHCSSFRRRPLSLDHYLCMYFQPGLSNLLLFGWWRTMQLALREMPARRARPASRPKEPLTS